MVIDTSALIAILQEEPEAAAIAAAIECDPRRLMSSVNVLEASIVAEARRGSLGKMDLDTLLVKAQIEVVPFLQEDITAAHRAYRVYGKGRHPAGLNFCDCVAYALAREHGETLLFKGDDFQRTDIASALDS